ncbi:signal peptidase [Bacillus pakistanensis]|uniref:Signal peptidase I n=1 Tax=Rossellomorea pakistanensis TaxID=992288 RepID=A0ABS2NJS5_9BACI|nr:signal peptidase I [Bacillus pakistanensis]MBM7588095.1 signal peptidase [Bacillus pakistanensis]
MKKAIRIICKVGSAVGFILLCLLTLIVLSTKASGGEPTILGHQLKTVLSGSMEPTFQTGSIIVIELAKKGTAYQKGDIITFHSEDKLITHRIIDVKKANGQWLYTTKGDNNDGPDSDYVLSQNIVGKYTSFTVPYAGYIVNYATSKTGSALLLFIPGLLLVFSAGRTIVKELKKVEAKNA